MHGIVALKALITVAMIASFSPAKAELRVIDGDTLDLQEQRYRIHGIDAPERYQKCGDWNCGEASTEALKSLVSGRVVRCVANGNVTYGRKVAKCYADGQDIAQALAAQGMA